jgi:hypothetical protein
LTMSALHLSLLVEFNGLFEAVEAGAVAVHFHEHLVALLHGSVLALHVFDLGLASLLGHVEVCLDAVANGKDTGDGLHPVFDGGQIWGFHIERQGRR